MSTPEASRQAAEMIIEQSKDMVAAPPVVFKLMGLLKRPNVHNQDVIDIIRYDENLTAKLLKLCNTAFFRASVPVDSVDQAILRLGNSNILGIVAALSIDAKSKNKQASYMNPYAIWRQSVTASIAAKHLSEQCRNSQVPTDLAFTAGLLHNIGMVVLNACPSEDIAKIIPLAQEKKISLIEAERELLQTDHAEIGGLLVERWQLPSNIVEAVKYQHIPDQSQNPLASLCHLASICAHVSIGTYPSEQLMDFVYPSVLSTLGIDETSIRATLQTIQDESSRIEAFMMVA
ncbi:MAG: HDOD domain-containing protein [Verrucomicrobiota bacterium]